MVVMKKWWIKLWLGAIVILYFVVIGVWIAIPDEAMLNGALTLFTLGLTAVFVILYRDHFSAWYESDQFSFQWHMLVRALLVCFILMLVNYLFFKHPWQKDFSRNSINTLTHQSKTVLHEIKAPAVMTIYGRSNDLPVIKALLDLYQLEKNNIEIKKIDVELRPDLYTQNEIRQSPTVLLELNNKKEQIIDFSELSVTNAFLKLSRDINPQVYYSVGHQELELKNTGEEGASFFKTFLDKYYYDTKEITLSKLTTIDDSVKLLMIWGPKSAFLDQEVKVVYDYLMRGGKLFIGLDPSINQDVFQNLRVMLKKFELNFDPRIVIDQGSFIEGSNGTVPQINDFHSKHAVTKNFKGEVFLPFASAIFQEEVENERGVYTILAKSSKDEKSWIESSPKEMAEGGAKYDNKVDISGPLPVMVSWEDITTKNPNDRRTKILAIGNSTLILNTYKNFLPHFYLVFNGISWLTDETRLISFNTPLSQEEIVHITAPHMGVIFYFSVVFTPLLLFGTAIWLYRRRLSL
jgi:hypothetical protein